MSSKSAKKQSADLFKKLLAIMLCLTLVVAYTPMTASAWADEEEQNEATEVASGDESETDAWLLATAYEGVYDGQAHQLIVEKNSANYFSYNDSDYVSDPTWTETNVGTYTVKTRLMTKTKLKDIVYYTYDVTAVITAKSIDIPTGSTVDWDGASHSGVATSDWYTLSGTNSASAIGTYTVTATLKDTQNTQWSDGTTGAKQIQWGISAGKFNITEAADKSYDAKETTTVTVTDEKTGEALTEGTHYTLTWDGANAGQHTVTATGVKGTKYEGVSASKTFNINTIELNGDNTEITVSDVYYNACDAEPTITVKCKTNGLTLTSGKDYTISGTNYASQTAAYALLVSGLPATFTVLGTGNYTTAGLLSRPSASWKVQKMDLSKTSIVFDTTNTVAWADAELSAPAYKVYISSLNVNEVNAPDDLGVQVSSDLYTSAGETTGTDAKEYTLSINAASSTTAENSTSTKWTIAKQAISLDSCSLTLTKDLFAFSDDEIDITDYVVVTRLSDNVKLGTKCYTLSGDVKKTAKGEYTVTASGAEPYTGSKNVTWKIAAGAIGEVVASEKTYDGSKTTTVVVKSEAGKVLTENEDYTLTWEEGDAAADAGQHKVTVNGIGNFDQSSKEATFTIKKVNPTVSISSNSGLTYNAASQKLVTASTDYGTLEFAIAETIPFINWNSASWSTDPSVTDAGIYYVYWRVAEGKNWEAVDASLTSFKTVTVSKAELSADNVELITNDCLVYNGKEQSVSVQVKFNENIVPDSNYYTVPLVSTLEATDAGEYTVRISASLSSNFKDDGVFITKKWTIKPLDISADYAKAEITLGDAPVYNGEEQTQTISKIAVQSKDETALELATTDYTVTGNTAIEVGEQAYTLSVTGTGNFEGTITKEWNVKQADNNVTVVGAANLVYNTKDQALIDAEATSATFGEIEYRLSEEEAWSKDIPTGKDADTYKVYWKVDGTKNYKAASGSLEVTISPRQLETAWLHIDPQVYKRLKNEAGDINQSPTFQIYYDVDGENIFLEEGTEEDYTIANVTKAKKGVYKLTLTGIGNYTGSIYGIWAITDNYVTALTMPSESMAQNLVYNAEDQQLLVEGAKVEVMSVETGEIVEGLNVPVQYRLGEDGEWTEDIATLTGKDAGDYKIYFKVADVLDEEDADKCVVGSRALGTAAPGPVTVTIAKADVKDATIELGDTLTFNGKEQTQTIKSVTVDKMTLVADTDYTVSGNKATTVSATTYTMTITGAGKNFKGTKTVDWNIERKAATVQVGKKNLLQMVITNYTKVYGQPDPEFGYVTEGFVEGYAFNDEGLVIAYDHQGEEADWAPAGTYEVTATQETDVNTNYAITYKSGSLTINKKSMNLIDTDIEVTADKDSYIYDSVEHAPQYTLTYNGRTLVEGTDYTLAGTTKETHAYFADYTTYFIGMGNFESSPIQALNKKYDWTIKPLDLSADYVTLSLDEDTYTFDEQEHAPAVTISVNPNGGDPVVLPVENYTLSGDLAQTDAGSYTITATSVYDAQNKYFCSNMEEEKTASIDWTIEQRDIEDAVISLEEYAFASDGEDHTAVIAGVVLDDLTVTYEIEEGTDVAADAGRYALIINGTGNFTGQAEVNWIILGADDEENEALDITFEFVGFEGIDCELTTGLTPIILSSFTQEELAAVANGEPVVITLTATPVETTTDELLNGIEERSGDSAKAKLMDLTLTKTIGSAEPIQIEKIKQSTFTMDIPESIMTDRTDIERAYYMIRDHEGEVKVLGVTKEANAEKITFSSSFFSNYAIGYVDYKVEDPEVPNTGDTGTTTTILVILLLALAAVGIGASVIVLRRKNK